MKSDDLLRDRRPIRTVSDRILPRRSNSIKPISWSEQTPTKNETISTARRPASFTMADHHSPSYRRPIKVVIVPLHRSQSEIRSTRETHLQFPLAQVVRHGSERSIERSQPSIIPDQVDIEEMDTHSVSKIIFTQPKSVPTVQSESKRRIYHYIIEKPLMRRTVRRKFVVLDNTNEEDDDEGAKRRGGYWNDCCPCCSPCCCCLLTSLLTAVILAGLIILLILLLKKPQPTTNAEALPTIFSFAPQSTTTITTTTSRSTSTFSSSSTSTSTSTSSSSSTSTSTGTSSSSTTKTTSSTSSTMSSTSTSSTTTLTTITTATITSNACTSGWKGVIPLYHCSNCPDMTPYQQFTYTFTALSNRTRITFSFREDVGCFALDGVSVRNILTPSVELIANNGFETGTLNSWTYCNPAGATSAGEVKATTDYLYCQNVFYQAKVGSYYYYNGAVGNADYLYQMFNTTVGQTYTVSYWLFNLGSGTGSSADVFVSY